MPSSIKDDALVKVLGPERCGRVRGLGLGATLSRIKIQNQHDERVKDLIQNDEYQNKKIELLEKQIKDLKNIVLNCFTQVCSYICILCSIFFIFYFFICK